MGRTRELRKSMATEIKHLCFDLDGTLIDSLLLMSKSWEQVQKDFNVNQSFKEYKKYIGIPFDEILTLLKIPKNKHASIKTLYNDYSKKHHREVNLYPKIKETLRLLKDLGLNFSVLTSKTKSRSYEILKSFNLIDFFDFVLCPEDLPSGWAKPSPLALLRVSELSDSKTNELLYIGDMLSDKLCSEEAGVKYIHCIYGYDPSVNAQNSISNFEEIIKFIK